MLNPDVAELLGLHTGDGTLYKSGNTLVWELRGGLDEQDYYDGHLQRLILRVFKIKIKPKFRSGGKNGCYGFQTSNKNVSKLFLHYGFIPGNKCKNVSIPIAVMNANKKIKFAYLRGVFDTDGCLRFDRINNREVNDYPKIELHTASSALHYDLRRLLFDLDFRFYSWKSPYFALCMAGIDNLERFMKFVSPQNPKFWNKYILWKEFGFYNKDLVKFIK